MYHIRDYTKRRAEQLNLHVEPSHNPKKKMDVYHDGKLIASVGDINYKDYPTYLEEDGRSKADERRRLYHLRHTKNTLNERLALYLLW